MKCAVTVENVVKRFKEAVVMDHVSVDFEQGKVHGLIGRNGSGKTMLMKSICGIVPLTSGKITVKEKSSARTRIFPTTRA